MPLSAQPSARFDISAGTRYVWHGLGRAAGIVLQPSIAAGVKVGALSVEGGAVRHWELDHVRPGELSEAGVDRRLGEDDLWVRVVVDPGPLRFQYGVVRYVFRGDPLQGGLGPERNTTETHFGVSAPRTFLAPTLDVWTDVGRVGGTYLSFSTSVPMLAWPFAPFIFLHVDSEVGLNLSQGPNDDDPEELANFASKGITHASTGLTGSIRPELLAGLGMPTLNAGFRIQFNFDDATRMNGGTRQNEFIGWVWLGATYAFGGDARRSR